MSFKESFNVNGENLLKKIKEIIAEGNVRKIIISDKAGKEILSFPVTIGVVGVVLLPVFAAIGALAALLTECTITVERSDTPKDNDHSDTPPPTENPNTPTDI
ncbi:DUF4342 domain-containing protein [Sphingobacterium pedocola]|uniref:DUF4342 domain-containing protein n=1 Tax=Sphingobacterium pedocola TaxID=2082722 RepID=A0ABR9T6L0_9SPHI|nr:DUF4342 domain-containing protein [Sphingobacterium pedocola]MBE8720992.1 hypothetical protein [Sphingobacterium pedocola]